MFAGGQQYVADVLVAYRQVALPLYIGLVAVGEPLRDGEALLVGLKRLLALT
ncbi:MAG: hypothetical protein ABWZ64_12365 [Xanthobacteraceae bacterium]|jgi:hypothetical protein